MKTSLLSLLFLSVATLLSAVDYTWPVMAPPVEITQFYHDVNFAACFSTPEERKLVNHMIETSATDKLSGRLQTLAQAVQRIRVASISIDPQMVHDSGAIGRAEEELTEIASMQQQSGNRIRVEVSIRSVSPEARSWLVAQYENPAKKSESAASAGIMTQVLKQTARKEVHVWQKVHGRWVRQEAAIVLLNLAK